MREIRFRAWIRCGEWDADGEKQAFQMIDADSLAFEEYAPLSWLLADIPDERYLMQYTGRKDENGREIYEGDIVDILPDYALPDGIVAWDNDFAGFVVKHPKYDDFVELSAIRVVVTNIYENPELIKEESCKQ